MGYNISEVSGYGGGPSDWTLTVDLSDPGVTTVSGDFDVVNVFNGNSQGEADSYAGSNFDASFNLYASNFTIDGDGIFSFDIDRQAVFQSGADQTVSFTITGTSGANSDDDTVSVTLLVCVAKGTLIETSQGSVAVEDIAIDDQVITRDNGLKTVRWVGCRRLHKPDLMAHPDLRPIRIRAGALGNARPVRDLLVSPQHRILVSDWRTQLFFGQDEVLIPAKALVDQNAITVERNTASVDYYHILFDTHQIIYTDGAETESFHPADYTLGAIDTRSRDELFQLFPELSSDLAAYGETISYVARVGEARMLTRLTGRPA
jgi:VCBS repeat-containing protein